eukprot:scaffold123133_cov33-Phaeocystis_antarctica.AAC.1
MQRPRCGPKGSPPGVMQPVMPGRGRTSVRPTFCEMFHLIRVRARVRVRARARVRVRVRAHQSEWWSASMPVSAALMPKQSARSSSRCEST